MKYTEVTPDNLYNSEVRLSDIEPINYIEYIPTKFSRKKRRNIPIWYMFILYYLTGSSSDVVNYLKTIGVQTKSGKPISKDLVIKSVWRWMSENVDWAIKFLKRDYRLVDKEMSDEEAKIILLEHASTYRMMRAEVLENWMVDNGMGDIKYAEKIRQRRPEVYKYFKDRNTPVIQE